MQDKAKEIGELDTEFKARQEVLEKKHLEEVKELKKKIDTTEANLNMVKLKNKTDEMKLRDEYRKNDRLYGENINAYDIEMRDKMRQKESMTQEFDQVHTQLTMIQDEYKQRLEERKKREEILAIMKKKNDEQLKQLSLLNKAAEWMQAHWRGLLARREMEKARKGKKKKKKK
jgi:hypothetical protein